MRSDHQTQSLHFFHKHVVRDRVDLSGYSNQIPHLHVDLSCVEMQTLLPSRSDDKAIKKS